MFQRELAGSSLPSSRAASISATAETTTRSSQDLGGVAAECIMSPALELFHPSTKTRGKPRGMALPTRWTADRDLANARISYSISLYHITSSYHNITSYQLYYIVSLWYIILYNFTLIILYYI